MRTMIIGQLIRIPLNLRDKNIWSGVAGKGMKITHRIFISQSSPIPGQFPGIELKFLHLNMIGKRMDNPQPSMKVPSDSSPPRVDSSSLTQLVDVGPISMSSDCYPSRKVGTPWMPHIGPKQKPPFLRRIKLLELSDQDIMDSLCPPMTRSTG